MNYLLRPGILFRISTVIVLSLFASVSVLQKITVFNSNDNSPAAYFFSCSALSAFPLWFASIPCCGILAAFFLSGRTSRFIPAPQYFLLLLPILFYLLRPGFIPYSEAGWYFPYPESHNPWDIFFLHLDPLVKVPLLLFSFCRLILVSYPGLNMLLALSASAASLWLGIKILGRAGLDRSMLIVLVPASCLPFCLQSAGYQPSATFVTPLILLFLLFSLDFIKTRKRFSLVMISFFMLLFVHGCGILLLPAYIYLLYVRCREMSEIKFFIPETGLIFLNLAILYLLMESTEAPWKSFYQLVQSCFGRSGIPQFQLGPLLMFTTLKELLSAQHLLAVGNCILLSCLPILPLLFRFFCCDFKNPEEEHCLRGSLFMFPLITFSIICFFFVSNQVDMQYLYPCSLFFTLSGVVFFRKFLSGPRTLSAYFSYLTMLSLLNLLHLCWYSGIFALPDPPLPQLVQSHRGIMMNRSEVQFYLNYRWNEQLLHNLRIAVDSKDQLLRIGALESFRSTPQNFDLLTENLEKPGFPISREFYRYLLNSALELHQKNRLEICRIVLQNLRTRSFPEQIYPRFGFYYMAFDLFGRIAPKEFIPELQKFSGSEFPREIQIAAWKYIQQINQRVE
ncbi:MAG: hypothetical protein PHW04_17590 [Candidatus Wallbacteria bacterium]|nr:hypothetical protein [Candidatus Wallbacteria bacterium]